MRNTWIQHSGPLRFRSDKSSPISGNSASTPISACSSCGDTGPGYLPCSSGGGVGSLFSCSSGVGVCPGSLPCSSNIRDKTFHSKQEIPLRDVWVTLLQFLQMEMETQQWLNDRSKRIRLLHERQDHELEQFDEESARLGFR
uniref:Uncharacterized protein n=1 Tax=Timema bartmani TaxID=61472 RepID=A0A7R9F5M4_9NEOP|nr:unnamed protein product [Timema bartmani]